MENGIDKIYDIIEKFDFKELSKIDTEFVKAHITEDEYTKMRLTIADTKDVFASEEDPEHARSKGLNKKVFFAIEPYKVAAAIIISIGLGFGISAITVSKPSDLLAVVDTVYATNTDTIILTKYDTVEIEKEVPVYVTQRQSHQINPKIINVALIENVPDNCQKQLCPDDIAILETITRNNSLANDTTISGVMGLMEL